MRYCTHFCRAFLNAKLPDKLSAGLLSQALRVDRTCVIATIKIAVFVKFFMLRCLIRFSQVLLCMLLSAQAYANVVVVLNSGDATVSLLDQSTYKEINTFSVGKEPHHLMATPDNKSLIVASATGNQLIFLDPKTGEVQRKLRGIVDPYQIGFSPDQKWFVANGLRLDRVDVYRYDGHDLQLVKRVPLAKTPSHIAFDADSTTAFITLQGSNEVSAIDLATQQVKWTMPVGKLPAGIFMTPDNKHLMIGIMGRDYVQVIDWRTQKIVKTIKAGEGAHNFRALGDKRHVICLQPGVQHDQCDRFAHIGKRRHHRRAGRS